MYVHTAGDVLLDFNMLIMSGLIKFATSWDKRKVKLEFVHGTRFFQSYKPAEEMHSESQFLTQFYQIGHKVEMRTISSR
jgi:hypothetical protein